MMSTRGTGFWELYYSDSIMTKGKYEVNAEFLAWAEENFHILKNAKMIGGNPANGVKLGGIGLRQLMILMVFQLGMVKMELFQ